MKDDILTKGDVVVNKICLGDIHYEFEGSLAIKCQVESVPERDSEGLWEWKSRNLVTGNIIKYCVREGYEHYSPRLYTYEAYLGCTFI